MTGHCIELAKLPLSFKLQEQLPSVVGQLTTSFILDDSDSDPGCHSDPILRCDPLRVSYSCCIVHYLVSTLAVLSLRALRLDHVTIGSHYGRRSLCGKSFALYRRLGAIPH